MPIRGKDLPRAVGREYFALLPEEVVRPLVRELEAADQNLREILSLIEDEEDLLATPASGLDLPRRIGTEDLSGMAPEYAEPIRRELEALDQNIYEILDRIRERFAGFDYTISTAVELTFSDSLELDVVVPTVVTQNLDDTVAVAASSSLSLSLVIESTPPALSFTDSVTVTEEGPDTQSMASTVAVTASSSLTISISIESTPPALEFTDSLTLTEEAPPNAPSSLNATDTSTESTAQVGLDWDNVADEDNYRIERRVSGGSYSFLTNKSADVLSHTDTTVSDGTTYQYRIRAENAAGNSAWTESAEVTPTTGGGGPA